jgi:hypothetical protein
MEPQRLVLRCGETLRCELLAVVRDHHATMPGVARDRPGMDRVHVRLPDGRELTTDVWTHGGQDLSRAPSAIELYDDGELLLWRPSPAPVVEAANDNVRRNARAR